MPQLSMNEVTTFRWSFGEDVENYQRAGYRSIGGWRYKLADWGEERAVDLLAESELSVSNLLWAGGFTGSDGRTVQESLDDAADALRLAAAIQAGCLVVYPGGRNNHTFRHASRLLRTALDELLPLAEAVEVPLAIQPKHVACAADWSFLTNLESVLELIHDFDSPYVTLAYDAYHFASQQPDGGLLADVAPHVAIVHLGDRRRPPSIERERCPLGCGRLPLAQTVATLIESGYNGPFDVKLMGPEIETSDYWTLLDQSRAAFARLAAASAPRSLA
jgi:sugar phosphate isomerase/epimerase